MPRTSAYSYVVFLGRRRRRRAGRKKGNAVSWFLFFSACTLPFAMRTNDNKTPSCVQLGFDRNRFSISDRRKEPACFTHAPPPYCCLGTRDKEQKRVVSYYFVLLHITPRLDTQEIKTQRQSDRLPKTVVFFAEFFPWAYNFNFSW